MAYEEFTIIINGRDISKRLKKEWERQCIAMGDAVPKDLKTKRGRMKRTTKEAKQDVCPSCGRSMT
jgi:hypothetical protein